MPAGNPDGGQWTSGGGGIITIVFAEGGAPDFIDGDPASAALGGLYAQLGTQEPGDGGGTLSDATPDPIIPGAQYAQSRTTITTATEAMTGISNIDETTVRLSNTLARVMETFDFIPPRFGPAYGVAVHAAFAAELRLEGIRGIVVEQTFHPTDVAKYGIAGSVRTDAALLNEAGDILAIYDLKTGGAALRPSRANELRAKTKAGSNVPVIELHFERGSSLKHEQVEESSWADRA